MMGLDLVSYSNLDFGLAVVDLDLDYFSSIYSEVNSSHEINLFNT